MQSLLNFISSNQKLIVCLIASFLILSPFFNIFLSFYGSGVAAWYEMNTLLSFLASVPSVDYICLVSFVFLGVFLLTKKRYSVHIAALIIFLITFFGLFRAYAIEVSPIGQTYYSVYLLLGTFLNLACVGLLLILVKHNKAS